MSITTAASKDPRVFDEADPARRPPQMGPKGSKA